MQSQCIIMFETDDWPDDWPEKNKKLYRLHDHFPYHDCGFTHRIIFQVDGFYRNPDEIRDYLLSCETTEEKDKCGDMIGKRVYETGKGTKAFEMQCNLKSTFNRLCKHQAWEKNLKLSGKGLYDQNESDRVWEKMPLIANITYGSDYAKREDSYNGKVVTYHKDSKKHRWAALVFLNKPEECEGGTKFYEFKDNTPMWEPDPEGSLTVEMKYNRMILYEADHCHGAILNRDMFKVNPRLVQVFFM